MRAGTDASPLERLTGRPEEGVMEIPGSIHAAMLTPLTEDAGVATAAIEPLADFILSRGVDGLYVGGSTGEAMLMSRDERAEVLRATSAAAQGRGALIAHVGAASTHDAVALARIAADAGYDAVAAVPPFYYKFSFDEIADYYRAIADAAGLPLMVYNIPALTGVALQTDELIGLLLESSVAGIKYTAKDLFEFTRLREAVPDKKCFFGSDEMFIAAVAAGTDGGIGSTYNLIGDVYVGIQRAVAAGDLETARRLQAKSHGLIKILLETGVVEGLKYAMTKVGVPVGPCRRPFRPAPSHALAKLDAWLDAEMRIAA
ncbi:N-acetylneuraminate lyase [Bauldia sp.]|uniref:N-acetylneuraminate lyase n=1 Tax=Bauldia sp. TaxID=2575872 RepID=UPI003BA9B915